MVWSSLRSRDWLVSMSIAIGVSMVMGMLKFAANLEKADLTYLRPTDFSPMK